MTPVPAKTSIPRVATETADEPALVKDYDSYGLYPAKTNGDGRCFFRSIVILLNIDMQHCERNYVTDGVVDDFIATKETMFADHIRGRVVADIMCEDRHVDIITAILNADMPQHIHFKRFLNGV